MSFWTGLEAFTGHRPGAFTGMTMKDLFDNDMWKRLPKTWSGKMGTEAYLEANPTEQMFSRGGEPMYTKWFDKNAGSGPTDSVNQQQSRAHAMQNLGYPSMRANYPAMPAQAQTRALPPRPELNPLDLRMQQSKLDQQGLTTAGQYRAGLQDAVGTLGDAFLPKNVMAQGREMWSDLRDFYYPGKDASNPQYDSTMQQMADMTTVKTITDDNTPNKITQTIKQQVPANPTNTLMNMGDAYRKSTGVSNNFRNPYWNPDWPTLSSAASAFGRLVNPVGNHLIHGWDTLNELRRKRHEDAMRARGGN